MRKNPRPMISMVSRLRWLAVIARPYRLIHNGITLRGWIVASGSFMLKSHLVRKLVARCIVHTRRDRPDDSWSS